MVFGDLYDMASRVKEYDSSYRLRHIEKQKYKVVAKRRRQLYEGTYNGCPLYSLRDYEETIFEFEHTPDMRIIHNLYETDVWRYPGGPKAFYDDMVRESETAQQRRDEKHNEELAYVAGEHHATIFDTKKTFAMGV